ncbi:hypothetical protein EJB05_27307, partial [Eragrostis curvula]
MFLKTKMGSVGGNNDAENIEGNKRRRHPPVRPPSSPPPPPLPPFLLPGGKVEVRVDADGYHGTWYEGTVREYIPAASSCSVPRCMVLYSGLVDDNGGGPLVEPFDVSDIRPWPRRSRGRRRRFQPYDIVEALDKGGWWSGIVVGPAAGPPTRTVAVAFPISREVIQFDTGVVRRRRDYIGGKWVPSKIVVAVQPNCPVKAYQVDEKVEVERVRDLSGGCSWLPATVVKVVDPLSYIVEYNDLDQGEGGPPGEKETEYLHWKFIRPAVDRPPPSSEFRFKPGAAVEAYCDGSWSPGVVRKVVAEGEYEVVLNGKAREKVIKVLELLKPHYNWDGIAWKSVSKRHTASRKRPISHVKVTPSDDEHCHHPELPSIKKSRKGLPHQEQAAILTEVSEHALVCEMDTPPASNDSLHSSSQLSGHTAPSKGSVSNVGETDSNHEILCNIVHSQNKRVETQPMQALQGKNDVPDNVQIQLKEKNSISNMEISGALSVSPKYQSILMPSKQVLTRINSCSTMEVYARRSSKKKCFEGPTSPRSSLDAKSARLVEFSTLAAKVKESQTQQQPHKTLKDTLNTDKVISQELLLEYNIKGIDIHDSLLEEESTATVIGSCESSRNADMLTDRAVTQVPKSNHHTEIYMPSVEHVQQDGGKMEERSKSTISNTLLESCPVAGNCTLSQLTSSQNADYELPFVRESPMWSSAEAMDVFKEVQQRPHFCPLGKHPLVMREGTAVGLMTTFATLVGKIKKSSIGDSMASFEENINALGVLGFSVQSLQSSLTQLLKIKSAYEKHRKEKEDLNAQMLKKMTSLSQINSLLDENEKAMEELRRKRKEIAMEKEHEDAELSRLKAADSSIEEACGDAECEFYSVLTELQRKTLT